MPTDWNYENSNESEFYLNGGVSDGCIRRRGKVGGNKVSGTT